MNKKRILLASCSIIAMCLCAIVGMTYALFTDSVSVKNHLQAGNLDIALVRTDLEYAILDNDGYLTTYSDDKDFDFTDGTKENVFGIESTDCKIVPGSYFDATLELQNKGNVAFTYSVKLVLIEGDNELADQLKVTLTHADGTQTIKTVSELVNGLEIEAGTMTTDTKAQAFSIKVEFVDGTSNNLAKDQTVVFDLVVSAVQAKK